MKTMLKSALLAGLTATAAQATVLLSETFTYTDGALIGKGTPAWAITGTSVVSPIAVSSNAVTLTTAGQDVNKALDTAYTFVAGDTLFYSADINLSAAQATGDYFFHLANGASNLYGRLYAKSSSTGYLLGFQSISGTGTVIDYGSTLLTFGTTYKAVISWDSVTGVTNDTFAVYVDPSNALESGNTAYVSQTWTSTTAEPTSIPTANLRQGTAANAPTVTIDNLIVATTFHEAAGLPAPVPEPSSTAALAGLVVLGAVATRRRRA